eukprot:1816087-Prorocentrum_lima.AAC.1
MQFIHKLQLQKRSGYYKIGVEEMQRSVTFLELHMEITKSNVVNWSHHLKVNALKTLLSAGSNHPPH